MTRTKEEIMRDTEEAPSRDLVLETLALEIFVDIRDILDDIRRTYNEQTRIKLHL